MTAATCPREESSLGRVQDLLADFFDEATARASSYGPHFERLWREAGRSVSGGKLVRPLLLLNAYAHPALEASIASQLAERLKGVPVTASAAIWPAWRVTSAVKAAWRGSSSAGVAPSTASRCARERRGR